jgi:hypothetical protein
MKLSKKRIQYEYCKNQIILQHTTTNWQVANKSQHCEKQVRKTNPKFLKESTIRRQFKQRHRRTSNFNNFNSSNITISLANEVN